MGSLEIRTLSILLNNISFNLKIELLVSLSSSFECRSGLCSILNKLFLSLVYVHIHRIFLYENRDFKRHTIITIR